MRKYKITLTSAVALGISLFGTGILALHGKAKTETSAAAIPGEKGGQDLDGPYEVVPNWPKQLSQCRDTKSGRGEPLTEFLPKARTECLSFNEANCR